MDPAIPYLGYIEVNLQIPGIRGYNEDVMLLVILTMIYAEKVHSHGGVQSYWQGNKSNYEGQTSQGNCNLEAGPL